VAHFKSTPQSISVTISQHPPKEYLSLSSSLLKQGKMVKQKGQASSSRVAIENPAFGSTSAGLGSFTNFKAVSPLSYLAEFPDVSKISNPETIVTFKNLFKKDSTTKTRALEDLTALFTTQETVEDSILDAWTAVYPRTSVETSRRVRQLAHTTQGQICILAGKRIIKHLPAMVGAWHLGLYDSDKSVSLAAKAALSKAFSTPEKQKTLIQRYQHQILEQCASVINEETAQTLSDERIVSLDEALAKYNRVLAAAIGLFSHMILTLDDESINQYLQDYTSLIEDKKLWALVASEDASVRRQLHGLVVTILKDSLTKTLLSPSTVSKNYVSAGLDSDQKGSASSFIDALTALTQWDPTLWTTNWGSKKSPISRLKNFLKKGSQSSASPAYWSGLNSLFNSLPHDLLNTADNVEELLESYRNGYSKNDESRDMSEAGLFAYISAVFLLPKNLAENGTARTEMMQRLVHPLLKASLTISGDTAISSNKTADKAIGQIVRHATATGNGMDLLSAIIQPLEKELIGEMRKPFENDSKYTSSQMSLSQIAIRWGQLFHAIQSASTSSPGSKQITPDEIHNLSDPLLKESMAICKGWKGRATGAATLVVELVKNTDSASSSTLHNFLLNELPEIFASPSSIQFGELLRTVNHQSDYPKSWSRCFMEARRLPWNKERQQAYYLLIESMPESTSNCPSVLELKDLVNDVLSVVSWAETNSLLGDILDLLPHYNSLNPSSSSDVVESSIEPLPFRVSDEQYELVHGVLLRIGVGDRVNVPDAIAFLNNLNRNNRIVKILNTSSANLFESTVMGWSENFNDDLRVASTKTISQISHIAGGLKSLAATVRSQIVQAHSNALKVSTLKRMDELIMSSSKGSSFTDLIPDHGQWRANLQPFLESSPPMSSVITSPLRGAVLLIASQDRMEKGYSYDSEKLSAPLRIAQSFVHLLQLPDAKLSAVSSQVLAENLELLLLTTALANDNISFGSSDLGLNDELELTNFVSNSLKVIKNLVEHSSQEKSANKSQTEDYVDMAIQKLHDVSEGRSPAAYRAAVAYHHLLIEKIETQGTSQHHTEEASAKIMEMRKSVKVAPFRAVAFVSAYSPVLKNVQLVSRWYNEMIADLTGPQALKDSQMALTRLVLLYAMIKDQDAEFLSTAAHQRVVFFIRGLVSWLEDETTSPALAIMAQAVFTKMGQLLLELFGDHWEGVISHVVKLWQGCPGAWDPEGLENEAILPILYESMKLIGMLKQLSKTEDCNEDLVEALDALAPSLQQALLGLLMMERETDDSMNAPLRIVNELICRNINPISIANFIGEPAQLYPLLAAKSESVQQMAFTILHIKIPSLQEELSMEVALGDTNVAQLPDELLSLIMDAPPVKDDEMMDWLGLAVFPDFDEGIPIRFKCYLYSWVLVFDHFRNAVRHYPNVYLMY
jgi:E3 ubiquitin-protein ligase listerin